MKKQREEKVASFTELETTLVYEYPFQKMGFFIQNTQASCGLLGNIFGSQKNFLRSKDIVSKRDNYK